MTRFNQQVTNIIKISIFVFMLLGMQGIAYSEEKQIELKHSVVYFTNPHQEFYAPFDRQQLFLRSRHMLMVGNKKILNNFSEIFLDKNYEKINAKNAKLGYFFYGKIFLNTGDYYEFYLDRNKDFELEGNNGSVVKGRLKDKRFKQLINLSEGLIDIVDMDYQWRKMID